MLFLRVRYSGRNFAAEYLTVKSVTRNQAVGIHAWGIRTFLRIYLLEAYGPREEVKYWTWSTCNFGNFARAHVRLSNLGWDPLEPFRRAVRGRYPTFRLLGSPRPARFYASNTIDTILSPPTFPRHFFPMFKIDELARERRDRFDTRSTRPRQRFVENSQKIPRKSTPSIFKTISHNKVTPLFAD